MLPPTLLPFQAMHCGTLGYTPVAKKNVPAYFTSALFDVASMINPMMPTRLKAIMKMPRDWMRSVA